MSIFPLRGLTCLECSIEKSGETVKFRIQKGDSGKKAKTLSSPRKHAKYLQKFVSENTNVKLKENAPLFFKCKV